MSDLALTILEKEIRLDNTGGFDAYCDLGRAAEGKKLSDLVNRVSVPLVVAVDAPWGAGKSFFLKCWVGQHLKDHGNTAEVVYFDAFKNDFLDDPLVGLTAVISKRIDADKNLSPTWRKAKVAAAKLARPLVRMGVAVGTANLSELAPNVVDSLLAPGADELNKATEEFWRREEGKREAMTSFRMSLEDLAKQKKLIVVVDELDRCRPDYALALLEIIKHFFDVPNVHFVLGVNTEELANSVRARYGQGVGAEKYLQKFVTVTMPLSAVDPSQSNRSINERYFSQVAEKLRFGRGEYDQIGAYIDFVAPHVGLGLRDVERIATLALVSPRHDFRTSSTHLYFGSLILKIVRPSLFRKLRSGDLTVQEVRSVFSFWQKESYPPYRKQASVVWESVCIDAPPIITTTDAELELKQECEALREALPNLISGSFDTFRI